MLPFLPAATVLTSLANVFLGLNLDSDSDSDSDSESQQRVPEDVGQLSIYFFYYPISMIVSCVDMTHGYKRIS